MSGTEAAIAVHAAVESGSVEVLRWMWSERFVVKKKGVLEAAAAGGHHALVEWFLALPRHEGDVRGWKTPKAACSALYAGHVALAERILEVLAPPRPPRADDSRRTLRALAAQAELRRTAMQLVEAAAHGCTLGELMGWWRRAMGRDDVGSSSVGSDIDDDDSSDYSSYEYDYAYYRPYHWFDVVRAAATSPTEDWKQKVLWLLSLDEAEEWAAAANDDDNDDDDCKLGFGISRYNSDDADHPLLDLERLSWLHEHGFRFADQLAELAARTGELEALVLLLDKAEAEVSKHGLHLVGRTNHLDVLLALHERGYDMRCALRAAARAGRVGNVKTMVERMEAAAAEAAASNCQQAPPPGSRRHYRNADLHIGHVKAVTPALLTAAVEGGCKRLVTWLLERDPKCGCCKARVAAVKRGSTAMVKVLAKHGCFLSSMGGTGEEYVRAAFRRNMPMLRLLRRLGCPWTKRTLTRAISTRVRLPVLQWLHAEGAPVDPDVEIGVGGDLLPKDVALWASGVYSAATAARDAERVPPPLRPA